MLGWILNLSGGGTPIVEEEDVYSNITIGQTVSPTTIQNGITGNIINVDCSVVEYTYPVSNAVTVGQSVIISVTTLVVNQVTPDQALSANLVINYGLVDYITITQGLGTNNIINCDLESNIHTGNLAAPVTLATASNSVTPANSVARGEAVTNTVSPDQALVGIAHTPISTQVNVSQIVSAMIVVTVPVVTINEPMGAAIGYKDRKINTKTTPTYKSDTPA